jgi:membrane protease YdiL (CAAX protease family)
MEKIKPSSSKVYRFAELFILFVLTPGLYFFDLIPGHKVVPLLILFLYCVAILFLSKPVNPNRFTAHANWKFIIARFIAICLVIFLWIVFFTTGPILADFAANKQLLVMTLIYPITSAFPQELIFREFFFYRYEPIIKNKTVMIGTNVILFSFAHLYFANWTVMIFTLAGGLIFAFTYLKTKSLLVVTIEHTIFGIVILSSGLANQFYKAF